MRLTRTVLASPLLPILALAVVVLLDLVAGSRRWGVAMAGLLDEPAHLATALVVLVAAAGPRRLLAHPPFTGAALLASVAIDIDHVPLYAGLPVGVDGGRPFTHCLLTPIVLAVAGVAVRRFRPVLLGLATGVLLHLLRDLATGPGVSLWWPVWPQRIELPYLAYLAVVAGCALAATLRAAAERRQTPGGTQDRRHASIGRWTSS